MNLVLGDEDHGFLCLSFSQFCTAIFFIFFSKFPKNRKEEK